MPTLSSKAAARTTSARALAEWVEEHLIGKDHRVHQLCFEIGRKGAIFFSSWLDKTERNAFVRAHGTALAEPLRKALRGLLAKKELDDLDLAGMPALRRFLGTLRTAAGSDLGDASPLDIIPAETLLAAFRDHGIEGLDEMIPAVLHTVAPLTGLAIDWEGMRESIRKVFESGCRWPAVFLSQNGSFGVGEVDHTFRTLLPPVRDPSLEVYFVDEKAIAHVAAKMTWPELEELLGRPTLSD